MVTKVPAPKQVFNQVFSSHILPRRMCSVALQLGNSSLTYLLSLRALCRLPGQRFSTMELLKWLPINFLTIHCRFLAKRLESRMTVLTANL